MVVPDSDSAVQQLESSLTASAEQEDQQHGEELEEVRKLRELVQRLELQNESLRNRSTKSSLCANTIENIDERTLCEGRSTIIIGDAENEAERDFETLSPAHGSSTSEDVSPLPQTPRLENEEVQEQPQASTLDLSDTEPVDRSDLSMDQSALDEVDVLNLDDCADIEDEDSWLYVSPKKQVQAEQGPESPLKWCRKVLDHPSPETEVACRTLLSRLDQTSRWRNVYSSPSQTSAGPSAEAGSSLSSGYHKSANKTLLTCGSSGYMGMQSALSSQSSIDSELSTSDDSISMGYKLQDLTDVQIMARLQEESLRQDYASSSASASRRSSAASLHSLRRGTYSDQELDSYSLEDEDTDSLSHFHRRHSPSPGTSPRCPSPSGYPGAAGTRVPRRSLQGGGTELLKLARSEEELRHSMSRTSLRSLQAVRNSRSMEANLQSSGNRMTRLPQSPTGVSSSRLRSNGQSPLSLRAPVKALNPVNTMAAAHQSTRASSAAQGGQTRGVRRVQSPGPAKGITYSACRTANMGTKQAAGRSTSSSRSRLAQSPRRSLGIPKTCTPVMDDSWKDGCY
ncbi:SLAIN motif-containing protein-like [Trichomycterus rosablanca]|uniref:SLAIN motif-containing protein-like n=1 Tax=Trichomycterus rosablanca TaxID=2290929 RepID=UPI002F360AE9